MMKIWASYDKEMRLTEIADDLVAANIMTQEYVIGVMLSRREVEILCVSLAEWCGIPLGIADEEE